MKERLKLTNKQKLIAVVSIGLLVLVIMWPVGRKNDNIKEAVPIISNTDGDESQTLQEYVTYQEKRLKSIVEKIRGSGTVDVMITAKASREIIVEKDAAISSDITDETDSSGGVRNANSHSSQESTVMTSGQNGGNEPYVIKSLEPEIEGVVVVAQGAGDAEVAKEITNTVSVLFNVPSHKVKVVQMD